MTTQKGLTGCFYFLPVGGTRGSGPAGNTLTGDSGWVGVISAPASFTEWKVVPGGVRGGRLSMTRSVWLKTIRAAADSNATAAAIITGFWKLITISSCDCLLVLAMSDNCSIRQHERSALSFENECSDRTQKHLGSFLGVVDLPRPLKKVPGDLKRFFDELRQFSHWRYSIRRKRL